MRYLITSKPGMTPWGYADTLDEAAELSRTARVQGLDGDVRDEETGEMVDTSEVGCEE